MGHCKGATKQNMQDPQTTVPTVPSFNVKTVRAQRKTKCCVFVNVYLHCYNDNIITMITLYLDAVQQEDIT